MKEHWVLRFGLLRRVGPGETPVHIQHYSWFWQQFFGLELPPNYDYGPVGTAILTIMAIAGACLFIALAVGFVLLVKSLV